MYELPFLSKKKAEGNASLILPGEENKPTQDMDQAYAKYLTETKRRNPDGVPMTPEAFERFSIGSSWLTGFRDAAKLMVQACRMVIGIHDYEYYVDHMRSRHPETTPLTREAFYRYCLEARFPSAERSGTGCPC